MYEMTILFATGFHSHCLSLIFCYIDTYIVPSRQNNLQGKQKEKKREKKKIKTSFQGRMCLL